MPFITVTHAPSLKCYLCAQPPRPLFPICYRQALTYPVQNPEKLTAMGIETVLQLADTKLNLMKKAFGVVVERTAEKLRQERQY